jgi:hypothetical protein
MWSNAGVESWAMRKSLARSSSFQFSGAMSATGMSPEAATLWTTNVEAPAQRVVSGDPDALAGEMPADGGADPQDVPTDQRHAAWRPRGRWVAVRSWSLLEIFSSSPPWKGSHAHGALASSLTPLARSPARLCR